MCPQKMDSQHGVLCKKYPDMVEESEKKLRDLKKNWERLEDLANARCFVFSFYQMSSYVPRLYIVFTSIK